MARTESPLHHMTFLDVSHDSQLFVTLFVFDRKWLKLMTQLYSWGESNRFRYEATVVQVNLTSCHKTHWGFPRPLRADYQVHTRWTHHAIFPRLCVSTFDKLWNSDDDAASELIASRKESNLTFTTLLFCEIKMFIFSRAHIDHINFLYRNICF